MLKLYFPTTSLNFNDMFATESVSPKSFYNDRGFGTKRNFTTEMSLNENFLTLFSTMPYFSLVDQSSSNLEEYPIIIEFNCDDSNFELIKLSDKVYASQETIYFRPDKVKFHFLSETHLKLVLAKSKVVEETKLVFRYKDNFRLIGKNSLTIISMEGITTPEFDETLNSTLKVRDMVFNKIKGFIYSYLIQYNESLHSQVNQSIKSDIDMLLSRIEINQNPYFDVSYTLLSNASKLYEQGLLLEKNELLKNMYPLVIEDYSNGNISLNKFLISDNQELLLFSQVINYLIHNHKTDHNLNTYEKVLLIEHIKKIINHTPEFGELYAEDIFKIHDRLVNKNYSYNFRDINSSVAQNLLVFLLKQDKLEELELILKENNISNPFISYSFLGISTGFSSLSRLVINSVTHNKKLLEQIDQQVVRIYNQISKSINKQSTLANNKTNNESLYATELFPFSISTDNEITLELKIVDLIQKIRESKLLKRLKIKQQILLRNNVTVLFEEFEDDLFIHFRKDLKNHLYILLRNRNNKSSEEQNNFKNNLSRLRIEKSNISRIAQGNYPTFFYFNSSENIDKILSIEDKEHLLLCLELLLIEK